MNSLPYGFLPIEVQKSICDVPMWRDGSSGEDRLSGEILLTLEALTPLLVGNQQYKINEKQSVLFPQMLEDGRVLIAGTSLKGMFRAALSSLLHAPMERVGDHRYTFRPNLGFGQKYQSRPAVISSVKGKDENAEIELKVLPDDTRVTFVRNSAIPKPDEKVGKLLQGYFPGIKFTPTRTSRCMVLEKSSEGGKNLDHYLFFYSGGIDGEGLLAKAFRPSNEIYRYVLVHTSDFNRADSQSLPSKVLKDYYETQEILADEKTGHLSPGHPLLNEIKDKVKEVKEAIQNHSELKEKQLIYIEIENLERKPGNPPFRILSMGHHFYYRWAYTSSVCYKNSIGENKELRPELGFHPQETFDKKGAPKQLTAARLFFGYSIDNKQKELSSMAKESYQRLAGRIAFNTAIEVTEGKSLEERFVEGGREIALHILGQPRPSAVEFYLKQVHLPNKLTTYGDLPDDPGGELAGRKYYRHQPDARTNMDLYKKTEEKDNSKERGTVVCYLSKPGTRFRATLRFDSLRPWELGAVLAVLDPGLLEKTFGLTPYSQGYAHKLGYGKPLGLGSVRIRLDAARWQENDRLEWKEARAGEEAWDRLLETSLKALKEKLQKTWQSNTAANLECWLKTKQWSTTGRASYPTLYGTIYRFHAKLRSWQAAARRGARVNFNDLLEGYT
ncbi:TIGR03986 family type III CRISPR-associated RAMP protein [Candidatus Methylacidiphilum infernorum]|uniref:CRISPR system related protein, RAMP superfamily n=1 Tax=Methylacidiphilum infernorum (isolate V4) TaxID=481448 RepID=B3E1D7_METI4|nr:TIGR03986 family CRISPR-associated RAMP protein [Candidatus Methylacidiphilum infernorum]ACD82933.1 CRISPR system related protein, RAMP superfamily [Methylacidiphilum infernorum V4]